MRFSLLSLSFLACGPIQLDGGDEGAGTDTGEDSGDGDTNETVDTAEGLRPEVTGVETVSCTLNTDGEPTWGIVLFCDDPQGTDTLGFGYAQLSEKGVLDPEEHPMVCVDGRCSVGWSVPESDACPAEGKGTTVLLVCTDKDGIDSFPYEYPW